jgi:hypothetical protein
MANFQKTTLTIAGILLLICIVIMIIIFLFPNTKQVWPPMVANCPDYYTDTKGDGSICKSQSQNIGKICPTLDFSDSKYIGSNGACEKYNTANSCGITWDGITYGVKNPCTNNSSS